MHDGGRRNRRSLSSIATLGIFILFCRGIWFSSVSCSQGEVTKMHVSIHLDFAGLGTRKCRWGSSREAFVKILWLSWTSMSRWSTFWQSQISGRYFAVSIEYLIVYMHLTQYILTVIQRLTVPSCTCVHTQLPKTSSMWEFYVKEHEMEHDEEEIRIVENMLKKSFDWLADLSWAILRHTLFIALIMKLCDIFIVDLWN